MVTRVGRADGWLLLTVGGLMFDRLLTDRCSCFGSCLGGCGIDHVVRISLKKVFKMWMIVQTALWSNE